MVAAAAMMLFFVGQTLLLQSCQFGSQGSLTFHRLYQLLAGKIVPRGGHHSCFGVMLPQQCHGGIQLGLRNGIGAGQDNGGSGLDLVVVELTKVFGVELDLASIGYGNSVTKCYIGTGHLFHGANDVGQLTNTGGFNNDPVGIILGDDLLKSLAKVAHQAAANAAGVHLRDVDAGLLEEAAVNTDLTELVFDEHQLLALVAFCDHFFDQSCLAGTQEAGVNINFCHKSTFCTHNISLYYNTGQQN